MSKDTTGGGRYSGRWRRSMHKDDEQREARPQSKSISDLT